MIRPDRCTWNALKPQLDSAIQIFSKTALRLASFRTSFGLAPVLDSQCSLICQLKNRHPQSAPSNGGWRLHPLKGKDVQEAVFNSYLKRSLRIWSSSLYSAVILWDRE